MERDEKGKFVSSRRQKTIPKKKVKLPLFLEKPDSDLQIQVKNKARYVITCAQNNTDLYDPFVESLLTYCKVNNAQLIVIPIRYKNVTAFIEEKDYTVFWPKELNEYYLNEDLKLNKNITIMASMKIQATAIHPLSGVGALAGKSSAVFGHGQISLKMLATPASELPRMLLTTGSVSKKNYSASKIGKQAEFHHTYGAAVVEIEDDIFFVRQINAVDDGSFYDLNYFYSGKKVNKIPRIAGLQYGDIHSYFLSPDVIKATWTNKDSIVNVLNPENEYLHDSLDFFSQNHHHKNNLYTKFAKQKTGFSNVRDELDDLVGNHNKYWSRKNTQYHYIASNHDMALTRWLMETDPRDDLQNIELWCEMQLKMLQGTDMKENGAFYPNPLSIYMKSRIKNPESTFFHTPNDSVMLHDIDQSQHGHQGPNGSRGSIRGFSQSGYKMNIGHSHEPGIHHGVCQAGTSSFLKLQYTNGYSSWLNTHIATYPNGKRTLIHIIGGKWRLEDETF